MKSRRYNWQSKTSLGSCCLPLGTALLLVGLALGQSLAQGEDIYLGKTQAPSKPIVKNILLEKNTNPIPLNLGLNLANGAQLSTWVLTLPRNVPRPNLQSKYSYVYQASIVADYKKIGLQIGFGGENTWIQSKETYPTNQTGVDSLVTIDFRARYNSLPIVFHYIPFRSKSGSVEVHVMGGPSLLFLQGATADVLVNVGNRFGTANATINEFFSKRSTQLLYGVGLQLALTPLVNLDLNLRNSVGLTRNNRGLYNYGSPGSTTITPIDIYLQNLQLLAGIQIRLTPPPVRPTEVP